MPRARFDIEVAPTPEGGSVTWMLAANPGEPLQPLARVASGGELARTMLAARLAVLATENRGEGRGSSTVARPSGDAGPATLVFDEVDAGVGGEAAVAVGRALHTLSERYQVLVVTHLPQVAAFAEHHLAVRKETVGALDRRVRHRGRRAPTGGGALPDALRPPRQPHRAAARRGAPGVRRNRTPDAWARVSRPPVLSPDATPDPT